MSVIIDEINSKILKELLKDGRKSFVEIAKECATSKDVIAKRYNQMKIDGIIVGATIQNSVKCYDCNFVGVINIGIEPDKEDQVIQLCRKIPQVLNIFHVVVSPNLMVQVILKNIEELDQVKQSIKKLPFILGVDAGVWMGIRDSPENLSILGTQETILEKKEKSNGKKVPKFDKIDKEIVKKLAINGRMPFDRIAKELKVSTDTIIRRYELLKQNGDIRVIIQINPTKIGYYAIGIMNLVFSQGNMHESLQALSKIPDINLIIKTSGYFDVFVSLMIRDVQQLIAVQELICKIPGLVDIQTSILRAFSCWPLHRQFISTF